MGQMRTQDESFRALAARVPLATAVIAEPLGRYIADFVAPSARLVVEVDGGWHAVRTHLDARRDHALERLGYRVLRLPARLVQVSAQRGYFLLSRWREASRCAAQGRAWEARPTLF